MPKVDDLTIKINADISDAVTGMRKTGDSAKAMTTKISKSLGNFSKTVTSATVKIGTMTVAVGGAVTAFASMQKVISEVDEVMGASGWARTLGISTKSFQELAFVAKQFNIDTDRLGDSMKDLNERIADAALDGTETYEAALRKLGLTSRELLALPMEEQFLKVTFALSKLTTQAEKNFVAAELMADAGFELIKMADAGEESIRKMRKEAQDLGVALTDIESQRIEKANQILQKLNKSISALIQKGIAVLTPVIAATGEVVIDLIKKMGGIDEVLKAIINRGIEFSKKVSSSFVFVKKAIDNVRVSIKGIEFVLAGLESVGTETALSLGEAYQKHWVVPVTNAVEKFFNIGRKGNLTLEKAMEGQRKKADEVREKLSNIVQELHNIKTESESLNIESGGEGALPAILKNLVGEDPVQKLDEILSKIKEKTIEFHEEMNELSEEQTEKRLSQDELEKDALESRRQTFFANLKKQEKDAQEAIRFLWESGAKGKLKISSDFFSQISVLMDTNSRTQFEIGKAAAIAGATVDTFRAANAAYSAMAGIPVIGPALGATAAAAAIAAGVANVQKIQSQSFGSGAGSAATGSAASTGAGAASTSLGTNGGDHQGQSIPQQTFFNIGLSGEVFTQDQVRSLIGAINEETDDNVQLRLAN